MTSSVGETVTITCISETDTNWKFEAGSLPPNAKTWRFSQEKASSLVIVNVQLDNAGIYTCDGEEKTEEDILLFQEETILSIIGR